MTSIRNQKASGRALLCAGLAVLLVSCSNPYLWTKQERERVEQKMSDIRQESARASAVPPDVSKALLPPIQITLPDGGTAPVEQRFDLSVNNAPARQVFMGLVEGTPYSMVVHPDVTGALSLNLKSVTVEEALSSIRSVYGFDYRREGNRFYVLSDGMQTRIIPVNYLTLVRKGKSDTRVSTGELGSVSSSTGGTSTARLAGIQVETDSAADFWKDLRDTLTVIVGTEGGRQVVVNPQASMVIVRALPSELRMVEEYLGLTHKTVNRQVILEAKIIEVQLNDGYQTGINWAALHGSSVFGQTGGGTLFEIPPGVSEIAGQVGVLDPTVPGNVNNTITSAFGGMFSAAIKSGDFGAFIELLQTQGNVNVLSSPRVSAINNQKAVIKVGVDEFFVTSITSTPSGVPNVPPTITTELTPFFSGIALDVTPQIDDTGHIVLHIHPTVSEVNQKILAGTVSGDVFSFPSALSSIQESDNIVRAASGQFVVIGGLMKEGTNELNASVPLLGDIPIAGNLFKHKKVTRIKRELVILLRPTVVQNGKAWTDEVRNTEERIRNMKR